MADASFIARAQGAHRFSIGPVEVELRCPSDTLDRSFALLEFAGPEGPWTVPHVHRRGRESFYILEGRFTFRLGGDEHEVGPGDFVSVAPGTEHMIRAAAGGGRFLTLVPAGLEEMFIEMSRLARDALTDPVTRKQLAERYDSVPV